MSVCMILRYIQRYKNTPHRVCIHTAHRTTHQQYIRTLTVRMQVNSTHHTQQHMAQSATTVKRKNLRREKYRVLYVHSYIINYQYAQTLIEKLL